MPTANAGACEACRKELPAWALSKCPICGHLTCHKCARQAYGREFCSDRCAHYFFRADGDDEDESAET